MNRQTEQKDDRFAITRVLEKNGESYERLELTKWKNYLTDVTQVYPDVKELWIGEDVFQIKIKNESFPNIKRVISTSPCFLSNNNGLLIASDGTLQNTFCKKPEEVLDFYKVTCIARNAMDGCQTTQVIHTACLTRIETNAFSGSAFMDPANLKNGVCMCGDILANMDEQAEEINLPISIQDVNNECNKKHYKKLKIHAFANYQGKVLRKVLTLRADVKHLIDATYESYIRFEDSMREYLQRDTVEFQVSGDTNLQTKEGILYTQNGKVLVLCPREKADIVTVPKNVTFIRPFAFQNCTRMTELRLPDSVAEIRYACPGCVNLREVTFGTGLKKIGNYAFYCCGFIHIEIPEQVTAIGESAFYGCEQLTTVTLGAGPKKISARAFNYCHNLETLTLHTANLRISTASIGAVKKLQLPKEPMPNERLMGLLDTLTKPKSGSCDCLQVTVDGSSQTLYVPGDLCEKYKVAQMIIQICQGEIPQDKEDCYQWTKSTKAKQETAYRTYQDTKSAAILPYLKRVGYTIFLRMLEEGREEPELIAFLKTDILAKTKLSEALELVQKKGLLVVSAYLLQKLQTTQTKPSKAFGL